MKHLDFKEKAFLGITGVFILVFMGYKSFAGSDKIPAKQPILKPVGNSQQESVKINPPNQVKPARRKKLELQSIKPELMARVMEIDKRQNRDLWVVRTSDTRVTRSKNSTFTMTFREHGTGSLTVTCKPDGTVIRAMVCGRGLLEELKDTPPEVFLKFIVDSAYAKMAGEPLPEFPGEDETPVKPQTEESGQNPPKPVR